VLLVEVERGLAMTEVDCNGCANAREAGDGHEDGIAGAVTGDVYVGVEIKVVPVVSLIGGIGET